LTGETASEENESDAIGDSDVEEDEDEDEIVGDAVKAVGGGQFGALALDGGDDETDEEDEQ
jgi:hypothetical protein